MITRSFMILKNKKSEKYFILLKNQKNKHLIGSYTINLIRTAMFNSEEEFKNEVIEFENLKELDNYVKETVKIWNGEKDESKSNHIFFAKE